MALTDQERIYRQALQPRIVQIWFALQPLKSVVSFMNSGAHPDDETSGMLAALRFRDGIDLSYVCSTRGEGGQNAIGTEAGPVLGTLRTAEMERAADVLDMRLYWLSRKPGDIHDFGFSKSGEDTLHRWGRDHTLARFVDVLRTEKPDILCPTFLDVPGQHGHHRAMTALAHDAVEAAADPDWTGSALPAWTVRRLFLPAWSGAGQSYDDDLPPPDATVTVAGSGEDPVTGWTWAQIGEQSRACHRTQGMGRWIAAGTERDFPLHLAWSSDAVQPEELTSGLPVRLADLGLGGELRRALRQADTAIDTALGAFPDLDAVHAAAEQAFGAVSAARGLLQPDDAAWIGHRLERKCRQLARVMRLSLGLGFHTRLDITALRPGERARVTEDRPGGATGVQFDHTLTGGGGWTVENGTLIRDADAPAGNPYPAFHDPLWPEAPAVEITLETAYGPVTDRIALETPPVGLPARSVRLDRDRVLLTRPGPFDLTVEELTPGSGDVSLQVPDGWTAERTGHRLTVTPPPGLRDGLHVLPVLHDGREAAALHPVDFPHVAPRVHTAPAEVRVRFVDCQVPDRRVAYVGSGNDRVAYWLLTLGFSVTEIQDSDLLRPDFPAGFDTLVCGIFSMGGRPVLRSVMPAVHRWVEAGGNLVTLYHRPWDAWDPARIPCRPLEIGAPSLRWRVTDESAEVTHLDPGHPLLTGPNRIGASDWDGWVKERGLYFAKSWDRAYVPLLSMADPGEAPLTGALLSAAIGLGRHTHTSLVLHHQMENLVPGAFRLMANLVGWSGT